MYKIDMDMDMSISSDSPPVKYQGCWEEYNVKKREGEAISSSLWYEGCWKEYQVGIGGRENDFLGKKIKIKETGGGEEYQVVGIFIHPCIGMEVTPLELAGLHQLPQTVAHHVDVLNTLQNNQINGLINLLQAVMC